MNQYRLNDSYQQYNKNDFIEPKLYPFLISVVASNDQAQNFFFHYVISYPGRTLMVEDIKKICDGIKSQLTRMPRQFSILNFQRIKSKTKSPNVDFIF